VNHERPAPIADRPERRAGPDVLRSGREIDGVGRGGRILRRAGVKRLARHDAPRNRHIIEEQLVDEPEGAKHARVLIVDVHRDDQRTRGKRILRGRRPGNGERNEKRSSDHERFHDLFASTGSPFSFMTSRH
jgi:hypothetical protein